MVVDEIVSPEKLIPLSLPPLSVIPTQWHDPLFRIVGLSGGRPRPNHVWVKQ
jgi:hypothetical protein